MATTLLQSKPTEAISLPAAGRCPAVTLSACTAQDAAILAPALAAMSPWSRYPFPPAALASYLSGEETGAPRFCIHVGGSQAGALGLRLNWLRGPYIQFLGLLPEYQGTGLGSLVLDAVTQHARREGQRNLWVAASSFNAGALRFYERAGFTACAVLEGLVQDGVDEVLLRKRL